jgi:hypothetical protein
MANFDDIRPYNDSEVRPAIDRMIADDELVDAVGTLRFPRLYRYGACLLKPLARQYLKRQFAGINSVYDFQMLVANYMDKMIAQKVTELTVSGLDKLDPQQNYLFISNHRDIAMDPAFVNLSLHRQGMDTVRIAIGDNLLTKPFVTDLIRVNKSFIVNRSAKAPREKYKAAKHLSAYIHHSIAEESSHIWIAQREGRAKDGLDSTNSAIISMLALSKPKKVSFADYIKELNIVPVAISYEWDPCDKAKANELYAQSQQGRYEKGEHEDVSSIAAGIAGEKGAVHLAFGECLKGEFDDADEVAAEIDRQIWSNYVLHPSNFLAFELLNESAPELPVGANQKRFNGRNYPAQLQQLKQRLESVPDEQKEIFLKGYANPIVSKQTLAESGT